MKDTIYRADAIEAVKRICWNCSNTICHNLINELSALPSAEVVEAIHDTEWVAVRRDEYEDFIASFKAKINRDVWRTVHITINDKDEPQDKAEKMYQICGDISELAEVVECLKEYCDIPSAEAVSREDTVTLNSPISIQAEMVAVVRCKDCKSSRVYGKTTQWLACEDVMEGQATDPNGYCYLGERREP